MYHDEKGTGGRRRLRWALVLAGLLAALAMAAFGWRSAGRDARAQSTDSIRQAVLRCAVQCYAVEGVYPENLDYLSENYGLIVDQSHYIVTYEAFSSNLMPEVSVLVRGDRT